MLGFSIIMLLTVIAVSAIVSAVVQKICDNYSNKDTVKEVSTATIATCIIHFVIYCIIGYILVFTIFVHMMYTDYTILCRLSSISISDMEIRIPVSEGGVTKISRDRPPEEIADIDKLAMTTLYSALNTDERLKVENTYDYFKFSAKDDFTLSEKFRLLFSWSDIVDVSNIECAVLPNTDLISLSGKLTSSIGSVDGVPTVQYSIGSYKLNKLTDVYLGEEGQDVSLEVAVPKDRVDANVLTEYKVIQGGV
jgi:hypothetical protein